MSQIDRTRRKLWLLAAVCAVLWGFVALSVHGWLTEPGFAGQIWPPDINVVIVQLLGGSVQPDVTGTPQVQLSVTSIWLRLVVLNVVLALMTLTARVGHGVGTDSVSVRRPIMRAVQETSVLCLVLSAWWPLWMLGETLLPSVAAFCMGCLPLWVSVVAAWYLWVWWRCAESMRSASVLSAASAERAKWGIGPLAVLLAAMLGWIGVSFWMNACLYQQLMIPHGDSAMYEEHLWNVWHGKGFRSYLDQGLFLGEHIQVIHLLLLPLHLLWPSHLLLELAESIALGSCAIPIARIALRHTGSAWAASLLGVAWLFYFPMHFLDIAIDQKTFRPIALGLPFLFWMIDFSERRHFKKASACLLLALSAKEDMALVTFPLLLVLATLVRSSSSDAAEGRPSAEPDSGAERPVSDRNSRRWLIGLAVFSAVYLVATVLVVIPAFRAGDHVHYSRYFGDLGGTPGELVRTAVTEPGRVLVQVFSIRTFLYVLVFLAPLGFLPLRKPWRLAAGVLTFGMLSLLQFGGPDAGDLPPVPYHHFHAPLLAVVFWAAVVGVGCAGVGRLLKRWLPSANDSALAVSRAMLVLLCCVATSVTGSLMPWGTSFWSRTSPFGYSQLFAPTDPRLQQRAKFADQVVQQIPVTARVAATDYIHTRLTHHERSYDYSGYLRAVNNFKPGVPADTDYIVIDTGHRYSTIRSPADVPELQQQPADWELLPDTTNGIFLVLKRR